MNIYILRHFNFDILCNNLYVILFIIFTQNAFVISFIYVYIG